MLRSKRIVPAAQIALSIVFLTCSLSEKTLAAMHEARLSDISTMIDHDGAHVVVRKLYTQSDTWDAVLKKIGTGADGWVQMGIVLHDQADGAEREMLEESFGEALGRKPSVLLELASQGKLKTEEFCIGPDVDDERYSSYDTASRALNHRIAAVRAVDEDALRSYRNSCLEALGSAMQDLHQFFDDPGDSPANQKPQAKVVRPCPSEAITQRPITEECVAAAIAENVFRQQTADSNQPYMIMSVSHTKTQWRFVFELSDGIHPPRDGGHWFVFVNRSTGKVDLDPGR